MEGNITNRTTKIKLSRSVGINENIRNIKYLVNADIFVNTDNILLFNIIKVNKKENTRFT